jgi:hypothetical protein
MSLFGFYFLMLTYTLFIVPTATTVRPVGRGTRGGVKFANHNMQVKKLNSPFALLKMYRVKG